MADRQEAKIKLQLDTKQAQAELRDLTKSAEKSGSRAGQVLNRAVKQGLGFFSVGAVVGAGIQTTRAATQSGFGDVIGETFGSVGQALNDFFLGDLDDEARASKAARESTIQAFGAIAGASGKVPAAAETYFQQIKALRLDEEKGASLLKADDDFRGPGIGDMIDRIVAAIASELEKAAKFVANKLNPLNWF